jgi:CHAD domain-containing protein
MLTLDQLAQPAADISLRIVHERLRAFLAKGEALRAAPEGEEALHDARVAIRRARVWLKLGGECLDVSHKDVQALRGFARLSSPVRDLEVQLVWLDGLQLGTEMEEGRAALREVLHAEFAQQHESLLALLPQALAGAERALAHVCLHPHSAAELESASFGAWMSERWMDVVALYLEDMPRLPEGLHALRLVGKQLRYMLEPLVGVLGAEDVLIPLRQGQDALGRVNDLQLLRAMLPSTMGALLGEQLAAYFRLTLDMKLAPAWTTPSIWVGLRAVSQAVLDAEAEAVAALHGWRLANGDVLVAGLQRVGVQLAGSEFDGFGNGASNTG